MAAGISTRNRATMEKSSLLLQVESLCGATGYSLRTPRLEDTMLDVHTREPVTVITEGYLGVLRFCRWSQLGHNQKLAQFISEIRVKRSHSMFYTNCHKIAITTGYCSWRWKYIHTRKTIEFSMLHRHLIFSFVYWYNRQVLLLLMICIYVVVVVDSHIQHVGCQPEKNYFTRWPIPLVV